MECEKNVIIMTVFWLGYLIHSLDNRAMTFLTDTCLSTHTDAVYKVKTSLRITCYQIMPSSNSAYQQSSTKKTIPNILLKFILSTEKFIHSFHYLDLTNIANVHS